MYCIFCGKQLPLDSTFCPHCGKKQHDVQPKPKHKSDNKPFFVDIFMEVSKEPFMRICSVFSGISILFLGGHRIIYSFNRFTWGDLLFLIFGLVLAWYGFFGKGFFEKRYK